ncbi:unnamed protein product [Lymnaea stagnalis]|uniref:Galectin n=1 Tax=Lymnaea stagnalis TaxID=6523 RepID=A0AAV2IPF6_LYMST
MSCTNVYRIPKGPLPGKKIIIHGTPKCNANTFSVNIVLGANVDCDVIAFHLVVRFNSCSVVCNSRTACGWGKEEVFQCNPFCKGVPFTMEISIDQCGYKISVNCKYLCSFNKRIETGDCNNFLIFKADVSVSNVQFC